VAGAGVTWKLTSNGTAHEAEARVASTPPAPRIVCTGRVEAVGGQVDVVAQLSGELAEMRVAEGDEVEKGELLAVIDARREAAAVAVAEANLALVEARLARVLAGSGEEEVEAAAREAESARALVESHRAKLRRMRSQCGGQTEHPAPPAEEGGTAAPGQAAGQEVHADEKPPYLQEAEFKLQALEEQYEAAQSRCEALRRGPLDEDVAAARAAVDVAQKQLDAARTNYGYRRVVAPISGTVLRVYLHTGDSVPSGAPAPVVRIADTRRLRVRLEVNEADAHRLAANAPGAFSTRGSARHVGRLVVRRVIPAFGPKRLFNPDTSARIDTRIVEVLCEVTSCSQLLYPGERITAEFSVQTPQSAQRTD